MPPGPSSVLPDSMRVFLCYLRALSRVGRNSEGPRELQLANRLYNWCMIYSYNARQRLQRCAMPL